MLYFHKFTTKAIKREGGGGADRTTVWFNGRIKDLTKILLFFLLMPPHAYAKWECRSGEGGRDTDKGAEKICAHRRLATNYEGGYVKCHQSIVNHLILACIIVYGRAALQTHQKTQEYSHTLTHKHTLTFTSCLWKAIKNKRFATRCPQQDLPLKAKLRNVFLNHSKLKSFAKFPFSLYLMANRLSPLLFSSFCLSVPPLPWQCALFVRQNICRALKPQAELCCIHIVAISMYISRSLCLSLSLCWCSKVKLLKDALEGPLGAAEGNFVCCKS